MRVLVTGGGGFVGSHTVDLLLEEGHEVVVLDNLDKQVHKENGEYPGNLAGQVGQKGLSFIRGDVRDRQVLVDALSGIEGVLHLAAAVGVGQSMYQPHYYFSVNVGGTAQLLDIIANEQTNVKKIVVASSMSIYGEGTYNCIECGDVYPESRNGEARANGQWEITCPSCRGVLRAMPTREDKPLASESLYAITKKTQEEMVVCFGNAYKIPVFALRYFNIYGPRQSLSNPYTGVVAIFLSRLMNQKPPIIFEDGTQSRDFIHVRDIARANVLALTSPNTGCHVMNIGCGRMVTVLEVLQELSRILSVSIRPIITKQFRSGDIRHCFSDSTKAKSLLGWNSQIELHHGLRDLIDWCKEAIPSHEDWLDRAYSELVQKKLIQ